MLKRRILSATFALFASALPGLCTTLDFESLSDLESVTNQFSGVTFANAVALTAGISLNEFDFPRVRA